MNPIVSSQMTLTMWWPHPDAFGDMVVEDWVDGYTLSGPENSLIGEWIAFWNQSAEHQEFFTQEFVKTLADHVKNGKTEAFSDRAENDRVETQKDSARKQYSYEPRL